MGGSKSTSGGTLPWVASLVVHSGLGLLMLLMPAQALRKDRLPFMELTERKLELPPEPEPPKPEPPKPVPKAAPAPTKVAMLKKPPRAKKPPPEPPASEDPPEPTPDADPAPPPSFGIKLEGASRAAAGQGVQVPEGQTLRAQPTRKKKPKGKKKRPPGRPGFKKNYKVGEQAPLAVVNTMPKILGQKVRAEYPDKMKELGIEGRVVLQLTINARGKVVKAVVLRSLHSTLDAAAIAAARKMRFSPGTVNGTPVTVRIRYKFTFVLD